MTLPIRRGYLDGRYGQLHYRHAAPAEPSARPLVLLHQNPSSSFEYEPLIAAMATDRRVIALDTPGYGESDGPDQPLSMAGYAAALAEALPSLGLADGAGCDLYGFHTGSLLAAEVAIAAPATVRHVAVTGLPMRSVAERAERLDHALHAAPLDEAGTVALGMAHDLWAFIVAARSPGIALERAGRVWVDKLRPLDRASWAYVGVWSYDYEARLPLVTQPVLLIQHAETISEQAVSAVRMFSIHEIARLPQFHRDLLDIPEGITALAGLLRSFFDSTSSSGLRS
jgi:pimeloyl-ACP methyl ester carboxylesterase